MKRWTRNDVRILVWFSILALLVACVGSSGDVRGQEPAKQAVQPEEDGPEEAASGTQSLGGMIIKSGWIGIPFYIFLGVLSLVAMSVILERLVRLTPQRVMPDAFLRGLRDLIAGDEDNPASYRRLCEASPSPVARILKAGLLRVGRPLPEVEKSMEDAASREMSAMRSRHQPLNVVGSIAPLVGLLGTVVGMIFAFYQSSQAGLGKAEVLAEYIYLALITTALGLTVAIPSMLFAAWYAAKAERFMREIDDHLMDALPLLDRMEGFAAAPATSDEREPVAAAVDR